MKHRLACSFQVYWFAMSLIGPQYYSKFKEMARARDRNKPQGFYMMVSFGN